MNSINNNYPLAGGEKLIVKDLRKELVGDGRMFQSPSNTLLKTMCVCFQEDRKFLSLAYVEGKGMKEYLTAQGFSAEDIGDKTFFNTTKPADIKKLFEIIVTNNDLDLNEVNRLRSLLQTDFADTGIKTYIIPSISNEKFNK